MKKLAIIGASHFQNPLIEKAKALGIETHVFAWAAGDIGERTADFFYPISIMDKEAILEQCRTIGIDGVASIGSDLANITVSYIAEALNLTANSVACVERSTNKHLMRECFEAHGDPSPKSLQVCTGEHIEGSNINYPAIVKPLDRSGSRGISRIEGPEELQGAIAAAQEVSFAHVALVEEFVEGREFSVETISWKGTHTPLTITEKFTTGAPHFIETGHLEPARLEKGLWNKAIAVTTHALDSLGIEYGASHTELKIDDEGNIKLIEIGSRMGGDFIGSDLVELSTGYDFVKAVVAVALGEEPQPRTDGSGGYSMSRFIFSQKDIDQLEAIKQNNPKLLRYESIAESDNHEIVDSSTRLGAYILASQTLDEIIVYQPPTVELLQ